jgi:hypothetical protein
VVRMVPGEMALEYIGRSDFQVKLRAFRIELGEIETALARHPQVAHAVACVREDNPGDARLVAYIVAHPGADYTDSGLRAHLNETVPPYMIPQHFVTLEAMPLTPNGKVDRKALPPPFVLGQQDYGFEAPATANEMWLADLWMEALRIPQVGRSDNFFDLGGHSLLCMEVIAKIAAKTGQRISPRVILLNTLEQVAAQIQISEKTPKQNDEPTGIFAKVRAKMTRGNGKVDNVAS